MSNGQRAAGPWLWEGGRPSLDLVNTYRDREGAGQELLRVPTDLDEWLLAAGLTPGPSQISAARLRDARTLREAVSRCVDAVLAGRRCRPADLDLVNGWAARRSPHRVSLRQRRGQPPELSVQPPREPIPAALAEIAADAVALLGTGTRATVRICANDDCGLRFVDRSPAGRRQWCSMQRCGNRAKARAHRARRAHHSRRS